MSYPYELDILIGSERFVPDNIGLFSFGDKNNNPDDGGDDQPEGSGKSFTTYSFLVTPFNGE